MQTERPRVANEELNRLAVASLALAVVSVTGLLLLGLVALAVFAVGAAHVALNQLKTNGGRGRKLAVAALVIGYAIAVLALFSGLAAIPTMITQWVM